MGKCSISVRRCGGQGANKRERVGLSFCFLHCTFHLLIRSFPDSHIHAPPLLSSFLHSMAAQPATRPLLPTGTVRQPQQNKHYGSTDPSDVRQQRPTTPLTRDRTNNSPNPETLASLYSRLTIDWMNPIFKIGYRRQLQEDDIFEMAPQRKTKVLGDRLNVCWEDEKIKARLKNRKPSLLRALVRYALPSYWFGIVCLFTSGKNQFIWWCLGIAGCWHQVV